MKLYQALRDGLASKPKFIPYGEDISKYVNSGRDFYTSLYQYTEEHLAQYEETGTVAGITDTTTDRLFFDFDSATDLTLAQNDALQCCIKLIEEGGVAENAINVSFSGSKGFAVELRLDRNITPQQFKAITLHFGEEFKTFDRVVNDANRIVRVINTKHNKSGNYKIPLNLYELQTLSGSEIVALAKNIRPIKSKSPLVPVKNEWLAHVKTETKPVAKIVIDETRDIDFNNKPKGWSACKWAIRNGFEVKEHDRNTKLLMIAATSKALGETMDGAYYNAKIAMKAGVRRYGGNECPKEDIWSLVTRVYDNKWQGGTYSCKDEKSPWLKEICDKLGHHKCNAVTTDDFVEIDSFQSQFKKFAENIEKNTLKIGVPQIDDKVMITTSMLVGLLGAPSSGKTSLLLNFLNKSSADGIKSIFFSMDMGLPLVYMRLVQKHKGIRREELFDLYRNNPRVAAEVDANIREEYKNVKFSFKSGLTVDNIKNAILDQKNAGNDIKLVGVDYLECITGPFSDNNANLALIANQLKDIANELDVCVLLLLQPQKHVGDPSDEITSMRSVKGSSVIEQACSIIMTMYRPGFSPKNPQDDQFVTVNTVKDRMGTLMSVDCGWNGLTGKIYELPEENRDLLAKVRERKRIENSDEGHGI